VNRVRRLFFLSLFFVLMLPGAAYGEQVYRVHPGESLYLIAQDYGISLDEIIDMNSYLRNPDYLVVNQLLIVPDEKVQPEIYVEEAADSESQDAKEEGGEGINSKSQDAREERVEFTKGASTVEGTVNSSGTSGVADSVPKAGSDESTTKKEPLTLGELFREYRDTVFLKGSSRGNKIALTFDDGPSGVTCDQAMDLLQEYNIPATFFLVGEQVVNHPEVVARMVEEGHTIGSHSWSHKQMDKMSPERFEGEIIYTEEIINHVTGKRAAMVRPPYGTINREGLEYLRQNGYSVVNWSVDSLDWKYPDDGDQVIINTLKDVRGGAIMLFHTLQGNEPSKIISQVLPEIIYTLRSQGYEFVTVDELLSIPPYKDELQINSSESRALTH
jgi:peptidoglycan/xylan/chitin deacetylase (PgdA/CDA1 family)